MAQLHRFDKPITRRATLDYWVHLPRDYDKAQARTARTDDRWPLVLFLHGKGERGEQEKAKKHGPPKRIAEGAEFPFIVVTPCCSADGWWEPDELGALLAEVKSNYRVDSDRVYCTGLSMGGFGTWATAITYPDLFAAIAPVCGGGSPYLASRIAHLPVWAFHGAKDPIVPLYESQRMVDALHAAGNPARITIYPDTQHDAWTQAYNTPELYEWLLAQRRNGIEKKG